MTLTLSNRIPRFIQAAIILLALASPAFAQISAHGHISACDQKKAQSDYANDSGSHGASIWLLQRDRPESTGRNSLASYCLAEILLEKRSYQASVNAYRDSLAADGNPVWTKVWSHIQIGKVFDLTGQRKRAVAQYQLAIQTGDNTDGAINQARELLEHPFQSPPNQ